MADEAGAMTLDWMSLTGGVVVATVAIVGVIATDAVGLVGKMNDMDAAHHRAVAEAKVLAERGGMASAAEPARLYYPDSTAGPAPMGSDTAVLIAAPRDSGGGGAFEPAIAEPRRGEETIAAIGGPSLAVPGVDGGPAVDAAVTGGVGAAADDCRDRAAANPFMTESLLSSEACAFADAEPVLAEPLVREPGSVELRGPMMPETDTAAGIAVPGATTAAGDHCDDVAEAGAWSSESLRNAACR